MWPALKGYLISRGFLKGSISLIFLSSLTLPRPKWSCNELKEAKSQFATFTETKRIELARIEQEKEKKKEREKTIAEGGKNLSRTFSKNINITKDLIQKYWKVNVIKLSLAELFNDADHVSKLNILL